MNHIENVAASYSRSLTAKQNMAARHSEFLENDADRFGAELKEI